MSEPQNSQDEAPYTPKRYFGMALDPIHIGTGGYRLGRVDNTIARDPTTNLPILFGSSIEGTARTYSAYRLIEDRESIKIKQGKDTKEYLDCAGKNVEETGKENRRQCGECEICITYGFSNKERSLHGMAQFSDARMLFFPVHTMLGPVWVTWPRILKDFNSGVAVSKNAVRTNLIDKGEKLNLGWMYLQNEGSLEDPKISGSIPGEILKRLVLVPDTLSSHIINSNLEVRTSVSIDPRTGAAEEGALFTYEAIPRGTVMYFTVTFLNPANFRILETEDELLESLKEMKTVEDTVKEGLALFEYLGIGGMGTRGFGRFKILNPEGDNGGQ
jgi:CRISPR-associated protein Cmr4